MIEAEKQNPEWWSNLRLARAKGCYFSKAQWSQCYLSPRSRSQETVRTLAKSGDTAQGSEGRRKYPGFSLFNSPTISQQYLPLAKSCWKTTNGKTWATQATGGVRINLQRYRAGQNGERQGMDMEAEGSGLAQ